MGKTAVYWFVVAGLLFQTAPLAGAGSQPPAVGGVLPEFALSVPKNDDLRQYLGVAGKKFTIPQIQAQVVIVQIFSMY